MMSRSVERAWDIYELRRLAKKRLPAALFGALEHGSEDDVAFRHNREVFDDVKLVHRVLRDVSDVDSSINLFGKKQSLPIVIGPTGITSWISYRGEISLARAAAAAGIPFTMTSTTSTPLETVLREGGGSQWYQAIIWSDNEATLRGIMRAKEAGFETLILTVDSLMPYNRPNDHRHRVKFPLSLRPAHFLELFKHPQWTLGTPARYILSDGRIPQMVNVDVPKKNGKMDRSFFVKDRSLSWEFVKRLRDLWPGNLVIKGILHPDDALEALAMGADAVVVSNHGGGTNDAAPASLEMLPGIADAVSGRIPVLLDSGVRRGSDVVKALALGADAVLVGRATLYGLAAGGEAGAHRAVAILSDEIRRMMGVLGVTDVSMLGRDHLLLPGDPQRFGRRQIITN